jgi:aminoglycoside/choline kinase family phosphotransferase
VLAGQRNMRILGLFVRLWRRDNKPHYTSFQKRMWGLMERNLAQPALAPVKAWFDANVPEAMRSAIWDSVKP